MIQLSLADTVIAGGQDGAEPYFRIAADLSPGLSVCHLPALEPLGSVLSLQPPRRGEGWAARRTPLPEYTVLIPFHAEPDAALSTMRSLASVTPAPREIIIIDDGSPASIAADC